MRIHDKESKRNSTTVVTVVIPCHNHADLVGRAIDSVLGQDYRPINIVVVDDGSDDNPDVVIQEKFEESKEIDSVEIFYIKNETATGPSAARNKAIKALWDKSDVFMMLDADDLYLKGKISKSVEKYEQNKNYVGMVYTDAIINNINKKTNIHEFRQPYSRKSLESECIISNTPLVSKAAISASGGYDEEMRTCEDWDLWLRITENFVAIHIPEPLHIYTVTGKNASDVVDQSVWQENWAKIRQRLLQKKNANT